VSILKVNSIQARTGTNINIPTGFKLVPADGASSLVQAGMTVQTVSKSTASGQELITTSQTVANIPDMSITITPKLATSKILLTYTMHIYINSFSTLGSWQAALTSLTRSIGGAAYSTLQDETTGMYTVAHTQTANSHRMMGYYTWQYFDTPNTTSAIIYQVQGRSKISDGNVQFNRQSYGPPGKFTAMEIAQ
jgi:hypothetical protein